MPHNMINFKFHRESSLTCACTMKYTMCVFSEVVTLRVDRSVLKKVVHWAD